MLIQERTLKSEEKDIVNFLDKNFKKQDEKYDINGEILSKDEIFKMLDVSDPISISTNSKNIQFEKVILNWWKNGKKPNEDTDYIFRTLKRFMNAQAKNIKLPKKAIEYNSPGEMDKDLDEIIPNDDLSKNYPGKIVKTDGDYVLRQIDTWEEAQQCFKDSGWCVQNKSMFDSYKPPYFMITRKEPNGTEKRVALAHKNSEQIKDVKDDPLPYEIGKEFLPLINYVFDLTAPSFYVSSDWSKSDILDYNDKKIAIDKPMSPNELELLSKNGPASYRYATGILNRRFPEGEAAIAKSTPELAYEYTLQILNKGRFSAQDNIKFPEGEPTIATNAQYAYKYANFILQHRFPAGEAAIAKDPNYAFLYARDIIKGPWPEVESLISKYSTLSFDYAKSVVKGRFPKGEAVIAKDPVLALEYARDVINKNTPKDQPGIRFPEAEATLAKDQQYAYNYAKSVINRNTPPDQPGIRWPEGEVVIAKNPGYSLLYVKYVIKGRFPEAEAAIATDAKSAYYYAKDVIKGRWPEGEDAIENDLDYAIKYHSFLDSLNSKKQEQLQEIASLRNDLKQIFI
jgi:lambda repressor-like predicted transcriptional regulator